MSRTLIISDLHIGSASRTCVLEHEQPLERLLDEVQQADRLVLLGDVVELMEGRARDALASAAPILAAIGSRIGAGGEVILVPGNHDRPLIRGWLRRRGRELEVDELVPVDASAALSSLARWLAPAVLEVRYPGVWLDGSAWATHGHYLDRHLIPVSAWGRLRDRRGRAGAATASPWQYEHPRRVQLSPALRWLPEPVAARVNGFAALLRATTMPVLKEELLDPRIAPLTARLLSLQMRRHALPAMARVVDRLGLEPESVVFGHVHRLGPLAGRDDLTEWRDPQQRTALLNSGSWVYEPRLTNRARPPHPYWPGGAVIVEDGSPPRALGLLDDIEDYFFS